jgi:hypothetical protein
MLFSVVPHLPVRSLPEYGIRVIAVFFGNRGFKDRLASAGWVEGKYQNVRRFVMKAKTAVCLMVGLFCMALPGWTQWQTPVNCGSGVNTSVADNSPWINSAGDTMYLASFQGGGSGSADIWMSVLSEGTWQPVTNLGTVINTSSIEFSPALSPDGQDLYFASNRAGGTGGWDIWVSHLFEGSWQTPVEVAEVNSAQSERGPFVTADGQKLYFVSTRTGGQGDYDIYVSEWAGSAWGAPTAISGPVNTSDGECHPTLTDDQQTMYFSSSRAGGVGNSDIYETYWTGSQWSEPQNLGYTLNSSEIDQFPAVTGDGLTLFFASGRAGGFGNYDIWESSYQPTTDLWGVVDLEGNPPDLSGSVVAIGALMDTTDMQGEYFLANVPQGEVTLVAFHNGYTPFDTVLVNAGGELNIMLYEGANPDEFFDDFESGIGNWFGQWDLTDESSHSPTHSLTDSPNSNYSPNQNIWQSMVQGVDLSTFQSGDLTYWTKYELETGFDYAYLEVSTDGGTNWLNLRTFNGVQSDWVADTLDIGSFAGLEDVRFRFRLTSDGMLELDGLYIDDFHVEGGHEDLTPPLVVHTPDADTVSWTSDVVICAAITDVSGVQEASLFYSADGGTYEETVPDSIVGDMYYFTIPEHEAGVWIEYYFHAVDNASPPNAGDSEVFAHIFGTILYYDDGDPEYIYQYSAGNRLAVWFTIPQAEPLAALIFRFYTDETHDLDSVDVYVWNDMGGYPYQVEVGPIPMYPINTLETPEAWSRVDMRPYGLTVDPDFHAGCQFRTSLPVILGDSPAVSNRSHVYTTSWGLATCDLHLRAVVGEYTDVPEASPNVPTIFSLHPAYPNPFNSTCMVPFSLARRGHATLSVYNILGQKVATLLDGVRDAGAHRITWNAGNVATGIYFLHLESVSDRSQTAPVRKVLLLK